MLKSHASHHFVIRFFPLSAQEFHGCLKNNMSKYLHLLSMNMNHDKKFSLQSDLNTMIWGLFILCKYSEKEFHFLSIYQ